MKVFRHIRKKDGFPREKKHEMRDDNDAEEIQKELEKYENIKEMGSHDGLPIFESFFHINS